ncbi:MAG: lipopolysaccharide heptosyltransferase II [Fidelibacterota bacterium]
MSRVPKNVLFIRFSAMGDIILSTPVIRAVRKKYPGARIHFLVKREYEDLLKFNSYLDKLLLFDAGKEVKDLLRYRKLIRAGNYDLILDLHNSLRSRLITAFIRGPDIRRIDKRVLKRFLLIKFKVKLFREMLSVTDRYFETVEDLGIGDDGEGLDLFLPPQLHSSKIGISGKLRICIHPGAGFYTKRWMPYRYAQLADRCMDELGAIVILIGSNNDVYIGRQIEDYMKNSPINLMGSSSILETAAVINQCQLHVCSDSGTMHVATALKKKVVAIFGPTTEELGFFPYYTEYRVIQKKGLKCRPCTHTGSDSCPEGHFKCMKQIEVSEVFEVVKQILNL